jgi:putative flippase GtrA
MTKRDTVLIIIIGAAVGLLGQPVIANVVKSAGGLVRVGFFLLMLIGAPVALYIASFIGKRLPSIYQFAKFAAVGVLNTMVDLGVFNLETLLLGTLPGTVLFAVFKAVSFLIATTNSYFWNKRWTFSSKTAANTGEVVKFYVIAILGGFVNVGVATLVKVLQPAGISSALWVNDIAPLAGIIAVLFWNFFGYKLFVFKQAESQA